MRPFAWISLFALALPASAQVVRFEEAWAAVPASVRAIPQKPAPGLDQEALRAALIARLKRNPVAAEYAVPVLEEKGGVSFAIRTEAEDASLKGAWATYKRDSRTLVLNRDAIEQDLPGPLNPAALADRYLPVFVHELGGHARHYAELAKILGKPAPNARETETNALRLEAMATAAERKSNPGYLRDDKEYAKGESGLVDKYWESKERHDPSIFTDYVTAVPGYAKIPSASGPSAEYYRAEEKALIESDRRLIGDEPPEDERGLGRRPFDESRSMRR